MLVDVDPVGAQPAQARVAGPADVFAGAVGDVGRAGHRRAAELRREHDTVSRSVGEDLAEERLAVARAVDVGGVEQRDPGVERGVDDGAGPLEVDAAAEVVAPEPDDRDLGPAFTQLPGAHEPGPYPGRAAHSL